MVWAKPTSGTSISRIQRWALFLAGYDYKFRYKPGKAHENADGLSRLPVKAENVNNIDPECTKFENIMLLDLDSGARRRDKKAERKGPEIIQSYIMFSKRFLGGARRFRLNEPLLYTTK